MVQQNKLKKGINYFFYLGVLFISFCGFPFSLYGLGSAKPLSTLFFLAYIILCVISANKTKILRSYKFELFLIVGLLIISLLFAYNYSDFSFVSIGFNVLLSYVITSLSFFFFYYNNKEILDYKAKTICKWILYSYRFSAIFGILQFISYKIVNIGFINSLIPYFVRDDIYIGDRIQFNFDEPSATAYNLFLVLAPTVILLKKYDYRFSLIDKITIGVLVIISFLSFSMSFYLILIVFVLLYLIFVKSFRNKYRIVIVLVMSFFILCISYVYFNPMIMNNILGSDEFSRKIVDRIENRDEDQSILSRTGYWAVSIEAFRKSPLVGYGAGSFQKVLKDNISDIDSQFVTRELINTTKVKGLQSQSIYCTVLAEYGLLGIVWLLCFLYPFRKVRKGWLPVFVLVFMIQSIQLQWLNVCSVILVYKLLSCPNVQRKLGLKV